MINIQTKFELKETLNFLYKIILREKKVNKVDIKKISSNRIED